MSLDTALPQENQEKKTLAQLNLEWEMGNIAQPPKNGKPKTRACPLHNHCFSYHSQDEACSKNAGYIGKVYVAKNCFT